MESTPQQPEPEDAWLLSPSSTPVTQVPVEPSEEPVSVDAVPSAAVDGRKTLLGGAGLVAAGLVAGALGTFAIGHHGSSPTTFQPAGSTTQQLPGGMGQQFPGGGMGQLPGGGPMGTIPGGPGGPGMTQQTQPGGVVTG